MKKSTIELAIELDDKNIPEKIVWTATDSPTGKPQETKAFALSLWDTNNQTTLKVDLWAKDMPVDEMKLFYIEAIGGMSETLFSATSDEYMYNEIKQLCSKLMEHLDAELKGQK